MQRLQRRVNRAIDLHTCDKLALHLLRHYCLRVRQETYQLMEIELYIYRPEHTDIFTHRHSKQQNYLMWYFHQLSEKEGSYKGGTYKGLDIALGDANKHVGVLIRGLRRESDGVTISGPCRCVNELLSHYQYEKVQQLVDRMKGKIQCFNNKYLSLELANYQPIVYAKPRVGLTLKGQHTELKQEYIDKTYRYLVSN